MDVIVRAQLEALLEEQCFVIGAPWESAEVRLRRFARFLQTLNGSPTDAEIEAFWFEPR